MSFNFYSKIGLYLPFIPLIFIIVDSWIPILFKWVRSVTVIY